MALHVAIDGFGRSAVFVNVLVGVDGRQGGFDAIALARELAAPGARITLAHVDPSPATNGRAERSDRADPHADARRMLSDARASAGVDARLLAVSGTSAARALHELARRRRCDLLVVGSCHRGALGRLFAGDQTLESLNGSTCAIAIAPRGYTPPPTLSRVGVGRDGSPESVAALGAARAIAGRTGATIEPLLVLPGQSIPYGQPIEHRWSEVAAQLTPEDLARLGGLDDLDGEVRYGSPGEQLARFSEDLDLLIVGSRSPGLLARLLAGSTSRYLARHACCPLLVFPRSADRTAGAAVSAPSH